MMAETVQSLSLKVAAFVDDAKRSSADGLTVAEFSSLTINLLRLAVAGCDAIPVDGGQKKLWVLEAVGLLFDAIAARLFPSIAIPFWVLTRPALRQLVLAASAGAIESLLPLVRTK
jgi:hypothetical protein